MSGKKLITEVAGVVGAPAAEVFDGLAAVLLPDGRRTGRFTVEDLPGHTSAVEVSDRAISFQGGWWYRGEWSVEPHPEGALLIHRVFDVAQRMRWAVAPANRFFIGFAGNTRKGFAESLTRLGDRLGCPTRLV
ncbi:hypothetical protein GCM10010156_12880 [Planobispora rosea]|uniref:Uncharacterized protein n=1 Tax=Planobispora rosea TaxID=35762 RepID=A0A8J3RYH0_PLARO|nr:hypothetical protein [Planobispora rosea]GGS55785.1 hypothetical protein GCM10010156_12880 [Planobispora rosea]GIH83640.1 hypothetical protein Pro02_20480 [Planobispora rosea]